MHGIQLPGQQIDDAPTYCTMHSIGVRASLGLKVPSSQNMSNLRVV